MKVDVGVSVGVSVGILVGVKVDVGVSVGVKVDVGVSVGVSVEVLVGVSEGKLVGVSVGVSVIVLVLVGVLVGVGLDVVVLVDVGVRVEVEVKVGVKVGSPQAYGRNVSCRPELRPPALHSYSVKLPKGAAPLSLCTPTVALLPWPLISPYTKSNLSWPSYNLISKFTIPLLQAPLFSRQARHSILKMRLGAEPLVDAFILPRAKSPITSNDPELRRQFQPPSTSIRGPLDERPAPAPW
jgi:hypothetical protein